jgi:hypothetical protein
MKAGEIEVYGRYGATPSKSVFDAQGTVIDVTLPKTGFWYFVIYNTNVNGTTANVTLTTVSGTCNSSFVGPTCSSPIENITTSLTSPQFLSSRSLASNSWYYFAVKTTAGSNPLWVSVAPKSSGFIKPEVYVQQKLFLIRITRHMI